MPHCRHLIQPLRIVNIAWFCIGACFLGFSAPHVIGQQTADEPLLLRDSAKAAGKLPATTAAVRVRAVEVDVAVLSSLKSNDRFTLNLFADVWLPGHVQSRWQSNDGMTHIQGEFTGYLRSSFIMVANRGAVAAIIRVPGLGVYRIRSADRIGQIVEELDSTMFLPCATAAPQAVNLPAVDDGGIKAATNCNNNIDVMILYTPEDETLEGGAAAVQAIAALAIDETNNAYVNSLVHTRVRLVYTGEVIYTESQDFGTDLDRLTGTSDGYMDEIHALRDQYGADLVDLLISNTQGGTICGIGWLMSNVSTAFAQYGFSVCNSGCANGGLTLPHELGHNMGCHHDRENASGSPAYDFSYGWRFTGDDQVLYRTIMSYAPGSRIPYFSNPDVLYQNQPTGVPQGHTDGSGNPDSADNAKTINLTASTVAGFRGTAGSGPLIWTTPTLLQASDGAAGDRFGQAVAMDGQLAIVGAYTDDNSTADSGSAYIFRYDGATQLWTQEAKLIALDGASNDRFGVSVDIVDDTVNGVEVAVVGAYLSNDAGRDSGSVYIFRKGVGGWAQETKLLASDAAGSDLFGRSVAIARTGGTETVLVGSYQDDDSGSNTGSVYVFKKNGGLWTQETKLHPAAPQVGANFGISVGLSVAGDGSLFGVVGAWKEDVTNVGLLTDAGAAYVFHRGATTWSQVARLTASDGAANDQFGFAVAIDSNASGNEVVVGAWQADGSNANSGAAYFYRDSGSGWTQEAKVTASDPNLNDSFGETVSINGDAAIIGAFMDDTAGVNDTGAAYVYRKTGSSWLEETKLTAPDGALSDQFGSSVAINNNRVFIGSWLDDNLGADSGSVYFASAGAFVDCNNNGVPDACDISSGASMDVNANGIPDECEMPACRGDINQDGFVNVSDLLIIINAWGSCPAPPAACPADVAPALTGDGFVNVSDLLVIINGWGPCP